MRFRLEPASLHQSKLVLLSYFLRCLFVAIYLVIIFDLVLSTFMPLFTVLVSMILQVTVASSFTPHKLVQFLGLLERIPVLLVSAETKDMNALVFKLDIYDM